MKEFAIPFGNLPPGCFEDDPRAPWNEEDPPEISQEEMIDAVYEALHEAGYEVDYKGVDQLEVTGYARRIVF